MHLFFFKDKTARKIRISPLIGMGCFFVLASALFCSSCGGDSRHGNGTPSQFPKPTIANDSMPTLHSVGVNTLISDSGIIRYRLVAEEWDIHTPEAKAATWKFLKGLLMLRLDAHLDVDLYVQADTAYLHNQNLWELRGRVRIRNVQGTKFNTEELFWDLQKHEMWNHTYMTIITPERTLEGTEFKSNEQMTRYSIMNSKGDFPVSDAEGQQPGAQPDTLVTQSDSQADNQTASRQRSQVSSSTHTMAPASDIVN